MELLLYRFVYILVFILTGRLTLTVEAKIKQSAISELKKYFIGEINRLEERFETAVKENDALRVELSRVKTDLANVRKERNADMTKLTVNFESLENQFIYEMNYLKVQLDSEREENKKEINLVKDELMKRQKDIEVGIKRCEQKPDKDRVLSPKTLANNDQSESNDEVKVASKNIKTDTEHTTKAYSKPSDGTAEQDRTDYKRQSNIPAGNRVAFFARLSNNTSGLNPNQGIVYDSVITNIGGGYARGTFTAPIPGTYVFTSSNLAYGATSHHAKLVKNGQLLAKVDFNDADFYDHSSQTVIVDLDKGDTVAVLNADYYNMTFHGDFYSTFAGFLLYENDGETEIVGK